MAHCCLHQIGRQLAKKWGRKEQEPMCISNPLNSSRRLKIPVNLDWHPQKRFFTSNRKDECVESGLCSLEKPEIHTVQVKFQVGSCALQVPQSRFIRWEEAGCLKKSGCAFSQQCARFIPESRSHLPPPHLPQHNTQTSKSCRSSSRL
jgi:hypothetical protein